MGWGGGSTRQTRDNTPEENKTFNDMSGHKTQRGYYSIRSYAERQAQAASSRAGLRQCTFHCHFVTVWQNARELLL